MQAVLDPEPDRDGDILHHSVSAGVVLFADRQPVPPQFRVVRQLYKNAYQRIFPALAEKFTPADRDRRAGFNGACARDLARAVLRRQMGAENAVRVGDHSADDLQPIRCRGHASVYEKYRQFGDRSDAS